MACPTAHLFLGLVKMIAAKGGYATKRLHGSDDYFSVNGSKVGGAVLDRLGTVHYSKIGKVGGAATSRKYNNTDHYRELAIRAVQARKRRKSVRSRKGKDNNNNKK
jgi:hypothetical protein